MTITINDDDVTPSSAPVQTTVNSSSTYTGGITGNGTAHATDTTSGNIMLSIIDNDGTNYNCTTISVSRDLVTAGAPAVNYDTNTATNLKVTAKVFTITSTNPNATGNANLTFYFTENEIAAWETATGNVRADLKIIKQGESTYMPVILGAYGTDVTVTANYTTGIDGSFYFGVDPALSTSVFELSNNISIYPNPTKDVLNISTTSDFGLPTSYTIYSTLGQVLKIVNNVGETDLTISTASYSNGIYFIQIEKDGATITKKFIKN